MPVKSCAEFVALAMRIEVHVVEKSGVIFLCRWLGLEKKSNVTNLRKGNEIMTRI
jgi:hypothetical protein